MSDRKELNGGSSWVFSGWPASSEEMENCGPVDAKGATSGCIVGGWVVDSKVKEGGSSGETGLEGIFEGEEIGDRKVTTELVGRSKPEGVRGRKSSLGRRWLKDNRHKGERLNVIGPKKRIKTNLNRGNWCHALVKLSRTHDWVNMLLLFLSIISHIM